MTAKYAVVLTRSAQGDLDEIHDYIFAHDAPAKAEYVVDRIEEAVIRLEHLPDRGSFPKELLALGIREYRETFFKPYRIIYRVTARQVTIHVIADGRRDMKSLLEKRLLR